MEKNSNDSFHLQENLTDAIRVWEHAAISLVDIRHGLISPDEPIRQFHLPASAFLYTCGGKVEVLLDRASYRPERFGLFHGGKGTELSVSPVSGWLEYYMVLYKAGEPPFQKREYAKLLEDAVPFRQQYGFAPDNPIYLSELLRRMYEVWRKPTPLDRLHGKSAFYQFVHEVYRGLDQDNIAIFPQDAIAIAKKYIDEHYSETISIRSIASLLGISDSHLRRCFKCQHGKSPQEYLTNTRLASAQALLSDSDLPIWQVAHAVGFPDEYNFSRSFMKHYGVTPRAHRAKTSSAMCDSAMELQSTSPYNDCVVVSQN